MYDNKKTTYVMVICISFQTLFNRTMTHNGQDKYFHAICEKDTINGFLKQIYSMFFSEKITKLTGMMAFKLTICEMLLYTQENMYIFIG